MTDKKDFRNRKRLLQEAQRLIDVPFPKRELGQLSGMLELTEPPATLSCSQFVRCVVDRAFGPDSWLRLVNGDVSLVIDSGARAMALALEPAAPPMIGDLHFFGDSDSDDWHVMLVFGGDKLIGACPGDAVRAVPASHFSGMKDQGARRMPLPSDDDQEWP